MLPGDRKGARMFSLKDMNIKRKIAIFPTLAIVVLLIVGGYFGGSLSNLKARIDDVFGSAIAHQGIATLLQGLMAVNGETHKLIVWTGAGYPSEQRDKLEASIHNLLQKIGQKIDSGEAYSRLVKPYNEYQEWIQRTIEMAAIDASAASMFAGSVEEAFNCSVLK